MRRIYKPLFAFAGSLITTITFAQYQADSSKTLVTSAAATEDVMRSNNKIYVVMAVCITILMALILYLVRIDRKISTLEKSS